MWGKGEREPRGSLQGDGSQLEAPVPGCHKERGGFRTLPSGGPCSPCPSPIIYFFELHVRSSVYPVMHTVRVYHVPSPMLGTGDAKMGKVHTPGS